MGGEDTSKTPQHSPAAKNIFEKKSNVKPNLKTIPAADTAKPSVRTETQLQAGKTTAAVGGTAKSSSAAADTAVSRRALFKASAAETEASAAETRASTAKTRSSAGDTGTVPPPSASASLTKRTATRTSVSGEAAVTTVEKTPAAATSTHGQSNLTAV